MNATKKAIRLKQIPFSWSRKLSNLEFTSLSNTMYESASKILGDNSALNQFLPQLKDANSELQALRPATTSHTNTALINEWHKVRKKRLSYIIVASRDLSRLVLHPEEHHNHYVFLHNWIKHYGKRLYDLGIDKLTAVMTIMEYDYDTNDEFREAIDLCFKRYYDDMIELTHRIVEAQISRSVDLSNSNPGRGYISVRKDVVCEWQFFISLVVDRIWKGEDVEMMILLYNTLSHFITEHRAVVKSRETRKNNIQKVAKLAPANQPNVEETPAEPTKANEPLKIDKPTVAKPTTDTPTELSVPKYEPTHSIVAPSGGHMPQPISTSLAIATRHAEEQIEQHITSPEHIKILTMIWDGKKWLRNI